MAKKPRSTVQPMTVPAEQDAAPAVPMDDALRCSLLYSPAERARMFSMIVRKEIDHSLRLFLPDPVQVDDATADLFGKFAQRAEQEIAKQREILERPLRDANDVREVQERMRAGLTKIVEAVDPFLTKPIENAVVRSAMLAAANAVDRIQEELSGILAHEGLEMLTAPEEETAKDQPITVSDFIVSPEKDPDPLPTLTFRATGEHHDHFWIDLLKNTRQQQKPNAGADQKQEWVEEAPITKIIPLKRLHVIPHADFITALEHMKEEFGNAERPLRASMLERMERATADDKNTFQRDRFLAGAQKYWLSTKPDTLFDIDLDDTDKYAKKMLSQSVINLDDMVRKLRNCLGEMIEHDRRRLRGHGRQKSQTQKLLLEQIEWYNEQLEKSVIDGSLQLLRQDVQSKEVAAPFPDPFETYSSATEFICYIEQPPERSPTPGTWKKECLEEGLKDLSEQWNHYMAESLFVGRGEEGREARKAIKTKCQPVFAALHAAKDVFLKENADRSIADEPKYASFLTDAYACLKNALETTAVDLSPVFASRVWQNLRYLLAYQFVEGHHFSRTFALPAEREAVGAELPCFYQDFLDAARAVSENLPSAILTGKKPYETSMPFFAPHIVTVDQMEEELRRLVENLKAMVREYYLAKLQNHPKRLATCTALGIANLEKRQDILLKSLRKDKSDIPGDFRGYLLAVDRVLLADVPTLFQDKAQQHFRTFLDELKKKLLNVSERGRIHQKFSEEKVYFIIRPELHCKKEFVKISLSFVFDGTQERPGFVRTWMSQHLPDLMSSERGGITVAYRDVLQRESSRLIALLRSTINEYIAGFPVDVLKTHEETQKLFCTITRAVMNVFEQFPKIASFDWETVFAHSPFINDILAGIERCRFEHEAIYSTSFEDRDSFHEIPPLLSWKPRDPHRRIQRKTPEQPALLSAGFLTAWNDQLWTECMGNLSVGGVTGGKLHAAEQACRDNILCTKAAMAGAIARFTNGRGNGENAKVPQLLENLRNTASALPSTFPFDEQMIDVPPTLREELLRRVEELGRHLLHNETI